MAEEEVRSRPALPSGGMSPDEFRNLQRRIEEFLQPTPQFQPGEKIPLPRPRGRMEGEIDQSAIGQGGIIPDTLRQMAPFMSPKEILPSPGVPKMPQMMQDPYNRGPGNMRLRREPPGYRSELPFYFG